MSPVVPPSATGPPGAATGRDHARRLSRSRRRRLALAVHVLLELSLLPVVGVIVLRHLDDPVSTPLPAAPAAGPHLPVVLVAGLESEGAGFRTLTGRLRSAGVPVVDFDPRRPGTQPLTYRPDSADHHIPYLAARVVQPAIDAALRRSGYGPGQQIDVVAHSLGGLLVRFLIEQPGADVDRFSDISGWSGDGAPDVETDWAQRVHRLVMVATPNRGSRLGADLATLGPPRPSDGTASDMQPGSAVLRRMGVTAPPEPPYAAVGGNPWFLRWLRSDLDGDGRRHGFDGAVPAESPHMGGAAFAVFPFTHSRLLSAGRTITLVFRFFGLPLGGRPAR
jgi:hypothetical protein